MVKQIVRDVFFLGQPSEPATKADIQVGKDLQDTLQANRERCVHVFFEGKIFSRCQCHSRSSNT